MRAQEIEKWRIGAEAILREAMAIKNSPPLGLRNLDQLAHETGLANARLTSDQRELTAPTARSFHKAQESG
jgi:hypothetical protein